MSNYSSIFYKADQRNLTTEKSYKCFSGINHQINDGVAKDPLQNLYYFDDVFLSPGEKIIYPATKDVLQLILPVVGTLSYNDPYLSDKQISAEEVIYITKNNKKYSIQNPYEKETINYLHIGLRLDTLFNTIVTYPVSLSDYNKPVSLNLDKLKKGCYAHTSVYKGRTKANYILKNPGNGVFAFIVNGAFEVEERLMEHRDGLALWNVKEIEFESLSEFAILLLLEIPLN